MATQHDMVEVEALEAFTVTRPYGQFHGDPTSERNKVCKVPADAVDELVRTKKIADPAPTSEAEEAPVSEADDDAGKRVSDPLDHDGDGEPGGSTAPEHSSELDAVRAEYKAKLGKNFFPGWDVAELRRRIGEHEAAQSASADPAPTSE